MKSCCGLKRIVYQKELINMSNSKYAGEFEIVLEKKNDKTVISEKRFNGLIKL